MTQTLQIDIFDVFDEPQRKRKADGEYDAVDELFPNPGPNAPSHVAKRAKLVVEAPNSATDDFFDDNQVDHPLHQPNPSALSPATNVIATSQAVAALDSPFVPRKQKSQQIKALIKGPSRNVDEIDDIFGDD